MPQHRLQFLACEKNGYRLAIDLPEIAAVQGGTRLALAAGSAQVDRVVGVLDPEREFPVPTCLRHHGAALRSVLEWRGQFYLRIAPELLLDFRQLTLQPVEPSPHVPPVPGSAHQRPVLFEVPCSAGAPLPTLAVSARQVLEIQAYQPPATVPAAPGRLLGLLPWQARLLPVIDLSAALGYAPLDRGRVRRTLILRCSSRSDAVAIPVSDQVFPARNLEAYRTASPPPQANRGAVRGAFLSPTGELLLVPDLDALV